MKQMLNMTTLLAGVAFQKGPRRSKTLTSSLNASHHLVWWAPRFLLNDANPPQCLSSQHSLCPSQSSEPTENLIACAEPHIISHRTFLLSSLKGSRFSNYAIMVALTVLTLLALSFTSLSMGQLEAHTRSSPQSFHFTSTVSSTHPSSKSY